MSQIGRQKIWKKAVSSGFISLVILGNVWFIFSFSRREAPFWLQLGFIISVIWVFLAGLLMLLQYYWDKKGAAGDDY